MSVDWDYPQDSHGYRQTDSRALSQSVRQTDNQSDRQTQSDRHNTDSQTDREIDRQTAAKDWSSISLHYSNVTKYHTHTQPWTQFNESQPLPQTPSQKNRVKQGGGREAEGQRCERRGKKPGNRSFLPKTCWDGESVCVSPDWSDTRHRLWNTSRQEIPIPAAWAQNHLLQ